MRNEWASSDRGSWARQRECHNHSEYCWVNKNIQFEKNLAAIYEEHTIIPSFLEWVLETKTCTAPCVCAVVVWLRDTYTYLGKIGQIFGYAQTALPKHPKIHLVPWRGTLPPQPSEKTHTSTPKPDENLGKETLNLGTHANTCSSSHPYSQVDCSGESKPLQPEHPRARLRLAQSVLHNCTDVELQEDPTAIAAVLQVSYLMWNESSCLDALDLSRHT